MIVSPYRTKITAAHQDEGKRIGPKTEGNISIHPFGRSDAYRRAQRKKFQRTNAA